MADVNSTATQNQTQQQTQTEPQKQPTTQVPGTQQQTQTTKPEDTATAMNLQLKALWHSLRRKRPIMPS